MKTTQEIIPFWTLVLSKHYMNGVQQNYMCKEVFPVSLMSVMHLRHGKKINYTQPSYLFTVYSLLFDLCETDRYTHTHTHTRAKPVKWTEALSGHQLKGWMIRPQFLIIYPAKLYPINKQTVWYCVCICVRGCARLHLFMITYKYFWVHFSLGFDKRGENLILSYLH